MVSSVDSHQSAANYVINPARSSAGDVELREDINKK